MKKIILYCNNNPSYLLYTMTMISMFTLTLTLENEKQFWFDNMKEAHEAMWTCMRKDVQFYYMERFIREGSKAHTSFINKVSKYDFFKKLEEKEDVPFETRLAAAKKSLEDDLNQSSEIITEKKLIVKEINNQPDILDKEIEKKAVMEEESDVSEPKTKKEKKKDVVVEETSVESDVPEPKPKKEKKKKEDDVQLCYYILSRGDRRGQECQKQCVSGKDKCKLHDK